MIQTKKKLINWLPYNRNLIFLALTALLVGMYSSVSRVIWQPFALSLGASISFIGILGSIITLDDGFFTMLIQPLGGWLGDRIGRKSVLYISSGIIILCFMFLLLAGAFHSIWLLIPAVGLIGLSAINRPSRSAMVSESVEETWKGTAFSIVAIAVVFPGIFAAILGGLLYERFGYFWIFAVSILLECLVVGLVFKGIKETLQFHTIDLEKLNVKKVLIGFFLLIKICYISIYLIFSMELPGV